MEGSGFSSAAVAWITPSRKTWLLKYANRHGLIAGATGTGKTVTLQILTEGFSAAGRSGVPVGCEGRSVGAGARRRADFKLHDAFTERAPRDRALPITPTRRSR